MSQTNTNNVEQQERPYRFADYFEYERVEQTKDCRGFINCKLTKRLVDNETVYEVGTIIPSIAMSINFYFWDDNDELTEDITVTV